MLWIIIIILLSCHQLLAYESKMNNDVSTSFFSFFEHKGEEVED